MSYSTFLYAVDIEALRAAVGSRNKSLIERVEDAEADLAVKPQATPSASPSSGGPTVHIRIAKGNHIICDGEEITIEAFEALVLSMEGGVMDIVAEYENQGDLKPLRRLYDLRMFEKATFRMDKILLRWEIDDETVKARGIPTTSFTYWKPEKAELAGPVRPKYKKRALTALINGKLDGAGSDHGTALEALCFALGKVLPDDDMLADLEPLELNTGLEGWRCPVGINEYADFPGISHLTADEVSALAGRLSNTDLSHRDEDIEEAREAFANCIKLAAEHGLGVVSFYK